MYFSEHCVPTSYIAFEDGISFKRNAAVVGDGNGDAHSIPEVFLPRDGSKFILELIGS